MAIGEAACVSVHGANRLGSNSLLDLVVFGRAAGLTCAETRDSRAPQQATGGDAAESLGRLDKFRTPRAERPRRRSRLDMQRSMQTHAAVFRDREFDGRGLPQDRARSLARSRTSGRRSLADLELRPGGDAGTGQPDGQALVTMVSARRARKAVARTRARTFRIATTRNWMKHTHVAGRGKTSTRDLPRRPHDTPCSERGRVHPAAVPRVLTRSSGIQRIRDRESHGRIHPARQLQGQDRADTIHRRPAKTADQDFKIYRWTRTRAATRSWIPTSIDMDELRTDGSGRADQDQERDRHHPDLPALLPRGDLRVVLDEHRRHQHAGLPQADRRGEGEVHIYPLPHMPVIKDLVPDLKHVLRAAGLG